MTFKLYTHAPFLKDMTSHYRCWGVISKPSMRNDGLQAIPMPTKDEINWVDMQQIDAVFIQRPSAGLHVGLMNLARAYNKPVWIDYDDDLFCVTKDNPTYSTYSHPETQNNVKTLLGGATIVTTSTEVLAAKLRQFSKNVVVIPNAIDFDGVKRIDGAIARNRCVVWRGSHCHHEDLRYFADVILEAYNRFPEWGWFFSGFDPYWITDHMDFATRCRVDGFAGEFKPFMSNLQAMRGAVHIVPLVDNPFNRAKSRIAHLEASIAGSVVLGPDWEEWQDGHLMRYKDKLDFRNKLFALLETPLEDLAAINNLDYEWVRENRSLEKINQRRKAVITQLQGGI